MSSREWMLLTLLLAVRAVPAAELSPHPQAGWNILKTHQYLPADLDDEIFAQLWTVWPEPNRSAAEQADAATRRRLMFSYYGLMPDPEHPDDGPALGYVAAEQGRWVMNCLACHGGKVAGKVVPGLPNSHFAMQTLTEDVSRIKLQQRKKLTHLDLGALRFPLSMTNGTTNAVIFGVLLGNHRRPDMTVDLTRPTPPVDHHDMDPPPFWNVKKKTLLYADGFSPNTHRPLMQFILIPQNGPDKLTAWEVDFRHIEAWIKSTEAPKYPFAINADLAEQGRLVFNEHCSRCHGTYGLKGAYEQKNIPIGEIGTDPVRYQALTPQHRQWMKDGWLSHYGDDEMEVDPPGYVAPPLDGIWASAPYFHNGSVPTLWHVLHPNQRPKVWRRSEDGYDQNRIGLEVEELESVPKSVKQAAHRRRFFDTSLHGKSPGGHLYPNKLTEDEKAAVLEYLKSL